MLFATHVSKTAQNLLVFGDGSNVFSDFMFRTCFAVFLHSCEKISERMKSKCES